MNTYLTQHNYCLVKWVCLHHSTDWSSFKLYVFMDFNFFFLILYTSLKDSVVDCWRNIVMNTCRIWCLQHTCVFSAIISVPVNVSPCPVFSAVSRTCCQLLQERREAIVNFMTEGRLNKLLDVLRARQAVTREAYENINAPITLSARTRCLLDTCASLGESVSFLVAITLGLVSAEAMNSYRCSNSIQRANS